MERLNMTRANIAELTGRGYTGIEFDMSDCHAEYYFADGDLEVKVTESGSIEEREFGREDWKVVDYID
jgi:hypothetical protein